MAASSPSVNYRAQYACTTCGLGGRKLWREYQTMADVTDLVCASCAVIAQAVVAGAPPFQFEDGDQMRDGLVPAVPTPDGSTFWGYSSVPDEDVLWWHALPTYPNSPDLEIQCLRNLALRYLGGRLHQATEYARVIAERNDLRWQLERHVYMVVEPITVTIWGSKTEDAGGGMRVRYGEEVPRALKVGDRIAVYRERAVVLEGDGTKYALCPTVMDCHQDGDKLVAKLLGERAITVVHR